VLIQASRERAISRVSFVSQEVISTAIQPPKNTIDNVHATMDAPQIPSQEQPNDALDRTNSISQASENSQTAADYISSQLRLEADAREALPYQFDTCTKPLGPLRQSVFACLTCTPPPASKYQQFTPAGVCYSCSISCHGEHNLVELFSKRDFVCDCGTTRIANSATPCNLRLHPETGLKGGILGDEARQGNKYNRNFEGKFCGCCDEYDPEKEKGTMFQCLGLGTVEEGGCGEDWWHPECLMGVPRQQPQPKPKQEAIGALESVKEEVEGTTAAAAAAAAENNETNQEDHIDEAPLPAGFPAEDEFDHLICYKCVDAFPWIKQYAGTTGFLAALPSKPSSPVKDDSSADSITQALDINKRKAEDDLEDGQDVKKIKPDPENKITTDAAPSSNGNPPAKHEALPAAPTESISLFLRDDFRDHFCRCAACFPRLAKHLQLLEEEDAYEPPMSEDGEQQDDARSAAGRSVHSGSLLERGEAALSSMDRVRAIEGVMAYNHVKDKVKAFLAPFAESGQAVGAEDIKAYFAKLRGDEEAARTGHEGDGVGVEGDGRKEQGGY
jgi:E3 ubiquitin-protein ligase UBR7